MGATAAAAEQNMADDAARGPAPQARPIQARRVELLVNPLAGHVGPGAAEAAEAILHEFDIAPRVRVTEPQTLERTLREAVDCAPDLLIVLAGDGTARAAASLCGADGPLLAPLAGGTMNVLPHAIYGQKDWQSALRETLAAGAVREVSGGRVNGQTFHVAAILGPPALWAEAREAARVGRLDVALRRARVAWGRQFAGGLGFCLDGGAPRKGEALALICPLVSRAMADDAPALEAAAMHPRGPAEAVRLGLHALFSEVIGDWRKDPAVDVTRCRSARAWAEGLRHVHAILDGEPMRLGRHARITFESVAFRALAPPPEAPEEKAEAHLASAVLKG
jgi:diacylglycerol kinase family enzyme